MNFINKDEGFPILEDGRRFTDYTQSSVKHEKIKNEYGIHNNRTYKEFLKKNTDLMMKRNFDEKKKVNNTPSYIEKNIHNVPYKFKGVMDTSNPEMYSFSDMKNVYLSREQLDSMRKRQYVK